MATKHASRRRRAYLDGLLLAVLGNGPLRRHAITTAVQSHSDGAFELRKGTIYPALIRWNG